MKTKSPLETYIDGLDNGYGIEAERARALLEAAPKLLAIAEALAAWVDDPDACGSDLADLATSASEAVAEARGRVKAEIVGGWSADHCRATVAKAEGTT